MDLHEDREKNLVTATFELPGLSKENVQLDVKDNVLTVSGESTISSEHNERGYAVRERRFGKFSRSLPLPEGVKVCLSSPYSCCTSQNSDPLFPPSLKRSRHL